MGFSHVDEEGKVTMVDVSHKTDTQRIATACGKVRLPEEVLKHVVGSDIVGTKGPIFQTAKIAGIQAAKRTSDLIPLCHPLPITSIEVNLKLVEDLVLITSTVKTTGKTGVEMEALTASSMAALCVYDMCKALSHNIVIEEVRLTHKSGGKSEFNA